MTKTLRKAIMHRSRLKNKDKDWEIYKKQINFCGDLFRKTKTGYFKNLIFKELRNSGKFWKTIKPYFGNKGLNARKKILKEKNITLFQMKKN